MVSQADRVLREAGADFELRASVLGEVMDFLGSSFTRDAVPAFLGTSMHRMVKGTLGGGDVYREKKVGSNLSALSLLGRAEKLIASSDEPLLAAFKVSLAGNLIDFGAYDARVDSSLLEKAMQDEPAINHYGELGDFLSMPRKILYITDNAGEIALDTLVVEELMRENHSVVAAVKSRPIINDATMEDAKAVGLHRLCPVITLGTDSIGVILEEVSEEFREALGSSELVLSKGQGNYEALSEFEEKPVLFLLKVKCEPVSEHLGVPVGSSALIFHGNG